jgi:hypothetical protein
MNLSRSVPSLSRIQSSEVTKNLFPICDEAEDDDVFALLTPTHTKSGSVTWLQSPAYDNGPYTAPLTNASSNFPINVVTHLGVQARACPFSKRQNLQSPHGRGPSLSDTSVELKPNLTSLLVTALPQHPLPLWAASGTSGLVPNSSTRVV